MSRSSSSLLGSLLVGSLLSVSLLAIGAPALACKCMLPPIEAAREEATVVFEGRVISVEPVADASPATNGELRVTLSVVRTWKGLARDERITLFTNGSSAACGYTFSPGASYLVYARSSEDQKLHVSSCSRTRSVADAASDLAELGAGSTPVTIEKARPASLDAGVTASTQPASGADAGNLPPPTPVTATPVVQAHKKKGCSIALAEAEQPAQALWLVLPLVTLLARRRAGARSRARSFTQT